MDTQLRTRGTVMMVVGVLMIVLTVLLAVATSDPMPVPFAIVGLVFVAVGARQRHQGLR